MMDLLERLAPRQDQGPGLANQPRDQKIGEDKVLEQFQKFFPTKFSKDPDPEVVEN